MASTLPKPYCPSIPSSVVVPLRVSLPRAAKPISRVDYSPFDPTDDESSDIFKDDSDDTFYTEDTLMTQWQSVNDDDSLSDGDPSFHSTVSPTQPFFYPTSPAYSPTSPAYSVASSKAPEDASTASLTTEEGNGNGDPPNWTYAELLHAYYDLRTKCTLYEEMLDSYDKHQRHLDQQVYLQLSMIKNELRHFRDETSLHDQQHTTAIDAANQSVMEIQRDMDTLMDATNLLLHFAAHNQDHPGALQ